jgi:ribonuclease VapC
LSMSLSPSVVAKSRMSKYVLDASAILALMFAEAGKDRVESVLTEAAVSRVNLTEVLTTLVNRGSPVDESWNDSIELELEIIEFDEAQSIKSAELRPLTKHLGLSLGDRVCLAVTILEDATAITADKNWDQVDVCKVEVIR